jgi:adenylate cyclase
MAVFGAPFPQPDHAVRALKAARSMHRHQAEVNAKWATEGLPPFGLGIGLSTGDAAAALLGSEERLEYTIVGDTVNLAARLQQWAEEGEIVLSEPTFKIVGDGLSCVELEPAQVKGRQATVKAYKITAEA